MIQPILQLRSIVVHFRFMLVRDCDRSISGCNSHAIASLDSFAEEMRTLGAQLSLFLSQANSLRALTQIKI